MALRLKECLSAVDVALAISDKQGFPLSLEERLLASLRVRDKVKTIRLPLKGLQSGKGTHLSLARKPWDECPLLFIGCSVP